MTVKRNYEVPKQPELVNITFSWEELASYLTLDKNSGLNITDQNWGKPLSPKYIDTNGDQQPDLVSIDYTFKSNEPVFTFLVRPGKEKITLISGSEKADDRLKIAYLTPFDAIRMEDNKPYAISKKIAESTFNIYPDPIDFPIYSPRRWNYEYSFFFTGCFRLGEIVNNESYIDYAQNWIDEFINPTGGFKEGEYDMSEFKLDDVLPGRLAILLHQKTNEPKYKSVIDTLISQLERQPRTKEGGYWHKQIYPYQMWLDGVFMADVFTMQYAAAYNEPKFFDEATSQIKLVYQHTLDSATGLMYHGWDESKNPVWADPVKGTSPEFWSRAIGWYTMALVECLDYLPENHPDRNTLIKILNEISSAVLKYQDKDSGLWYQVMDKGENEGNWLETSSSAMFAYTFAKGSRLGYLNESYKKAADNAYNSLLDNFVYVDNDENLHLEQTVKVGTLNTKNSKGDYDYYISTERRIDDYKGLAALLFVSIELNR